MSKVEVPDILSLGITKEMYSTLAQTDEAFEALIGEIITEQSAILEGRIGTEAYNSALSPFAVYVKRAEKCLTAAELIQRRINIILGNSVGNGSEIDISHEGAQKKAYFEEAENFITKLTGGDYAGGVVETFHSDIHEGPCA